jgi:hypothetical protein
MGSGTDAVSEYRRVRGIDDQSTYRQAVCQKKQQMRWTPRGAYLLLQIRAQVLNDDLHGRFEGWYPGLHDPKEIGIAA